MKENKTAMAESGNLTEQIKRYQSILMLLVQHGKAIFMRPPQLEMFDILPEQNAEDTDSAKNLKSQIEALGPTFIKLGQAMSVRSDLLPQAYLDELVKLQDEVAGITFEQVESVFESEFGIKPREVFAEFSTEPLAVASLGQVHSARLQNGDDVVVKIQRPGIREQVISDLNALEAAAKLLDEFIDTAQRLGLLQMVDEFRRTFLLELDYMQEAQNLRIMAENLSEYESITLPGPVDGLCSSRVLTMSHVEGKKVTEIMPVSRLELEAHSLATDIYKAYLDQMLVHGFVHGDPHPGNIMITSDGRLAMLDLGMCTHVDPAKRIKLLKILIAISEGRGEEAAELALDINTPLNDYNHRQFLRQTAAIVAQTRKPAGVYRKTGRVILELARISTENNIRPAPEFLLLGRTFLYLDKILEHLEPGFNPVPMLEKHILVILKKQTRQRLRSGRIMANSLELQDLLATSPRRLNQIIELLARNELKLKLETLGEARFLTSMEKIANRIAAGLVLASLIIGAALLMSIETKWTLFGYPILAIILFLIAVIIGFILVINVVFNRN